MNIVERTKSRITIQNYIWAIRDHFSGSEKVPLKTLSASIEPECDNLLVITGDYEGTEQVHNKTIQFIPLWKWLLLS